MPELPGGGEVGWGRRELPFKEMERNINQNLNKSAKECSNRRRHKEQGGRFPHIQLSFPDCPGVRWATDKI